MLGKIHNLLAILILLVFLVHFSSQNWYFLQSYPPFILVVTGALLAYQLLKPKAWRKIDIIGTAVVASIIFISLPSLVSFSAGLLSPWIPTGALPAESAFFLAAALFTLCILAILFFPYVERISRNYSKLLLAAVFILSLKEGLQEVLDSEFFWWLSLAAGRPAGCYLGAWHGNEPRVGAFFSLFLNIISTISGKEISAYPVYAAILSTICVFFIYKACKEALGAGTAEIVLSISAVSFVFPFVRVLMKESSMQNLLIALFVWLFFVLMRTKDIRLLALLSLVAGIGIQNKIFFLTFLASFGIANFLAFGFRRLPSIREISVATLPALAGSAPFIAYNLLAPKISSARFLLGVLISGNSGHSVFSPTNLLVRIENFSTLSGSSIALTASFLFLLVLAGLFALLRRRNLRAARQHSNAAFLLVLFLSLFALSSISYYRPQNGDIHAFTALLLLSVGAVFFFSSIGRLSRMLKSLVVITYLFLFLHFLMNYPRIVAPALAAGERYSRLESFLEGIPGTIYVSDCRSGVVFAHFSPKNNVVLEQANYSGALESPEGNIFVFSATKIPPGTAGVESNGPLSRAAFEADAKERGLAVREVALPALGASFYAFEALASPG